VADQGVGSQMELRAIQKRNRDETVRARENGEPKQRPSYGYLFVRPAPTAKIDHVEIDEVAAEVIREVARRARCCPTVDGARDLSGPSLCDIDLN
jgi:hypothetical protein